MASLSSPGETLRCALVLGPDRTTPTLGCIQGKNRDTRLSGAFGGFPVRKQRLSFLSPSAMAHYGLLFARGWFTKSLGATVFGLIGVHQLAKKYYDIPTYRDFNLTNWSYALERENLRRQGIDPDSVDLTGENNA